MGGIADATAESAVVRTAERTTEATAEVTTEATAEITAKATAANITETTTESTTNALCTQSTLPMLSFLCAANLQCDNNWVGRISQRVGRHSI